MELFCPQRLCISSNKTDNKNSRKETIIMNKLELKGNWNETKGKLKEKYAVLTDNDLAYKEGQEDQLVGHLQEKLGKTKKEVKDILRDI